MKERILKKASADKPTTPDHHLGRFSGNPHSRENVNAPMGPRHGNTGAHEGKRGNFLDAKEARAPLADYIENAYAVRGRDDREEEEYGVEGISEDNPVRKFKTGRK